MMSTDTYLNTNNMENYFNDLTNRALLKEARQIVERYLDVKSCLESGSRYYLGDPIRRVLRETKQEVKSYENEVTSRYNDAKWDSLQLKVYNEYKSIWTNKIN